MFWNLIQDVFEWWSVVCRNGGSGDDNDNDDNNNDNSVSSCGGGVSYGHIVEKIIVKCKECVLF